MSTSSNDSKLHVAMFPWFAYGHLIPFLHLSNNLARRGHRVSFLLPKGAQQKMEPLCRHPHLIHFFPLVVPQFDGLPPGSETASNVPLHPQTDAASDAHLHDQLFLAFDQTQDQVETILTTQKPDFVFYDSGYWVPSVVRPMGTKCIFNPMVSAFSLTVAFGSPELLLPSLKQTPEEAEALAIVFNAKNSSSGSGMSLFERVRGGVKESDAVAFRTFREIEGVFCDYIAQQVQKPVLLMGHLLPDETQITEFEDKWCEWLSKFEPSSVVYCAFGSQIVLQKDQFQELLLGFELSGQPFLLALQPPEGCSTVEEAFPEGFAERVGGRGWVIGTWVPQPLLLSHPSVGCYVCHCGFSSFWEALLSDCQIVLIPQLGDQIPNSRFMAKELKVGVEVERGKNGWVARDSLSKAIKLVMDRDGEIASLLKNNHTKLKEIVASREIQEEYMERFIGDLRDLIK